MISKYLETIIKFIIADTRRVGIGIASVLGFGKPGTGKTYFMEKSLAPAFLQGQGEVIFYQCHEGTGKEELLYDLDIRGIVEKLSGSSSAFLNYIQEGVILKALKQSQKQKILLILDEIDKSRPAVDGFLLDILQNGRVYDPAFGMVEGNTANLIFAFTSNDERQLSEALLRRPRKIQFQFPSHEDELKILREMGVKVSDRFIKFLITVANYYRDQEVIKSVSSYELARICFDLEVETDINDFLYWFSPYREDQEIILKKFPRDYLFGMLKGAFHE